MPGSLQTFSSMVLFLAGLAFGSFLNVIVYRLPRGLSLVRPPSQCPSCQIRLSFLDLIPLVGYLLLGGRCRKCRVKISLRYPLVELATGLLFLLLFYYFGLSADYFFYLILLFTLLAISLIDLEHRIVPNGLVAFGLTAGLIFHLFKFSDRFIKLPAGLLVERSFIDALWGFLLGGGIILAIFLVSRGGMGAGDIKLMAMIGFYIGLQGTVITLFLGFIFGALVGIFYMILGKLTRKDALPFAPFLSLGALAAVLWGDQIWSWYINLLR